MDTSVYLARLSGPVLAITGIGILICPNKSAAWLLLPSEMRNLRAPLLSETLLLISALVVLAAAVPCFFGYIANTRTGDRS
ncbi:hypothetical protein W911_08615 [Hyphomicrobium nitrativorans NL23]|uniref:Uncharacterized protein n=1 Tax=Hyphomicrobium nitrativorans NL23 TaxID=1029756 RepID=V5SHZ6_9HYPH|nr:hypothetical protein [Hyphomicrobium nitrativorans]AHB50122.1 hypothetical protein W911_08615 [Hyphomicrobium nitrativorans NL23]